MLPSHCFDRCCPFRQAPALDVVPLPATTPLRVSSTNSRNFGPPRLRQAVPAHHRWHPQRDSAGLDQPIAFASHQLQDDQTRQLRNRVGGVRSRFGQSTTSTPVCFGHEFTVCTDHQSLRLRTQPLSTAGSSLDAHPALDRGSGARSSIKPSLKPTDALSRAPGQPPLAALTAPRSNPLVRLQSQACLVPCRLHSGCWCRRTIAVA